MSSKTLVLYLSSNTIGLEVLPLELWVEADDPAFDLLYSWINPTEVHNHSRVLKVRIPREPLIWHRVVRFDPTGEYGVADHISAVETLFIEAIRLSSNQLGNLPVTWPIMYQARAS